MHDFKSLKQWHHEAAERLKARLSQVENIEFRDGEYRLTGEYYEKQLRIALRNCGIIDPESLDEAVAQGAYMTLAQYLENKVSGEEMVDIMTRSNLRGRGGAGFPTGCKWAQALPVDAPRKYIICNADEGDPGAYMDRSILENDPHAVLEGMALAGLAIGADTGYVYVRAEYPLALKRLNIAIDAATKEGLLGNHILGTDFSFNLEIRLGAGAFVCGEGTALMESIEGKRGMPRAKVKRTAVEGLFKMPTIINNVETLANVPWIFYHGADAFRAIGTENSPGTKVFALVGKAANSGLVEVPMGVSLNYIVNDIGGGCKDGRELKSVQIGGPSGGCIPAHMMDTPVDYDSLKKIGAIMGSGGLVVMDDNDCMVDIARFFMEFTVSESCGKCTPCRIGNKRVLEMLERFVQGEGSLDDLDYLEELCTVICDTSLCGLGQSAPNPVLSTIRYFRDEYAAHIVDRICPAHVCQNLLRYEIGYNCIGCGLCTHKCPVDCISGEQREKHDINQDLCTHCGSCYSACPVGAIERK